jgi:hypothetical protein
MGSSPNNLCTTAVRDSQIAYNQPLGCVCMHCNLRVSSSSFIVSLRVQGIFSSLLQYDIIVPTLVFEKVFIYIVYLHLCSCCDHEPLAYDMQVGQCIL